MERMFSSLNNISITAMQARKELAFSDMFCYLRQRA